MGQIKNIKLHIVTDIKYTDRMLDTKVYVGNLPNTATELDLCDTFERFGSIESVSDITHRESNSRKGFAFITFTREDAAEEAVVASRDRFGVEVQGTPCIVEWPRMDKNISYPNNGSGGGHHGSRHRSHSRYSPEPYLEEDRYQELYDSRRQEYMVSSPFDRYSSSPRVRKNSKSREHVSDCSQAYSPLERRDYSPDRFNGYNSCDQEGYTREMDASTPDEGRYRTPHRGYGRRGSNMEHNGNDSLNSGGSGCYSGASESSRGSSCYSGRSGRSHVSRYGRREKASPVSNRYDTSRRGYQC